MSRKRLLIDYFRKFGRQREEILLPVVAIAHQSGVAYRCGCQLVFHHSSTPWCGLPTPYATDCELIHEARGSVTETVPSTLDSRQPPSKASAAEEPQPLRPARRTCAAATYAKEDRSWPLGCPSIWSSNHLSIHCLDTLAVVITSYLLWLLQLWNPLFYLQSCFKTNSRANWFLLWIFQLYFLWGITTRVHLHWCYND
jgi:hypothetical protein